MVHICLKCSRLLRIIERVGYWAVLREVFFTSYLFYAVLQIAQLAFCGGNAEVGLEIRTSVPAASNSIVNVEEGSDLNLTCKVINADNPSLFKLNWYFPPSAKARNDVGEVHVSLLTFTCTYYSRLRL